MFVCIYRCAQLSHTTQNGAVLIIFPLYLQTTTIAQMLSVRGQEGHIQKKTVKDKRRSPNG